MATALASTALSWAVKTSLVAYTLDLDDGDVEFGDGAWSEGGTFLFPAWHSVDPAHLPFRGW